MEVTDSKNMSKFMQYSHIRQNFNRIISLKVLINALLLYIVFNVLLSSISYAQSDGPALQSESTQLPQSKNKPLHKQI